MYDPPFLEALMITASFFAIFIIIVEAAHEKRESVSNKIRKLKLSRFN